MTDLPTIQRLMTAADNAAYEASRRTENAVCARCQDAPVDPDGFYPELCPTCNEVEYGEELAPEV